MSKAELEVLALEIIAFARAEGLRSRDILSFVTRSISDEHPILALILYQQLEATGSPESRGLIGRMAKKDLELAIELTFYFGNGSKFKEATSALFGSLDISDPAAVSQIKSILAHYADKDDFITADGSLAEWIRKSTDLLVPSILQQIYLDSDQFGPDARYRALDALWQQVEPSSESAILLLSLDPTSVPPNFVLNVTSQLIKINTPISEIVKMGKQLEPGTSKEEVAAALLGGRELLEANLSEIAKFIAEDAADRGAYIRFASHLLNMHEDRQSTAFSPFSEEKKHQLLASMFDIALQRSMHEEAERLARQVRNPDIQDSLLAKLPPNQKK